MCVDIQIISSTRSYEPVAFEDIPYRYSRAVMMFFAIISLVTSVAAYVFCFITFGGI